jgi:hypothetical protein
MTRTARLLALLSIPAMPAWAQGTSPAGQAPSLAERCDREGEEIVVCGERGSGEAYRLPPQPEGFDSWGGIDSVSRERNALLGTGPAGNGSCTTVGPGGWTGCDIAVIKQAEQQGKRVGIGTGRASIAVQVGRKRVGTDFR